MNVCVYFLLFLVVARNGITIDALKVVIFGDSTVETNGCISQLMGFPYPPTPPYSSKIRFSADKVWVDYFVEAFEGEIDIIDCSCSGAMATSDGFDFLKIPGLITQIQNCNATQDLQNAAESDELVAIIMIGGNDLFNEITGKPNQPPIDSQQFAQSFDTATRQLLLQFGAKKVLIGNTVIQGIYSPFDDYFRATFFPEAVEFASFQRNQLNVAFDESIAVMQQEGLAVDSFPMAQYFEQIQSQAKLQGINGVDPCFNFESSLDINLLSVLPNCTEFSQRMWIDGLHLSDWGHQQFSKKIEQFMAEQQLL